MRRRVSLVHMNVVNTVPWTKPKNLVRLPPLRPPPLPERVDPCGWFLHGALDVMLDLVTQIIVRTREVGWKEPHVRSIKEITADEIHRRPTRLTRQQGKVVGQTR